MVGRLGSILDCIFDFNDILNPLIPANAGTQIVGRRGWMSFYVYIVASRRNGTIYIGMTDDLARRIHEHKIRAYPGFTDRYGCDKLVWYEVHDTREGSFQQERRMKEWRRSWKLRLIEEDNSTWIDLYETLN
jgi:putative endonuclease